MKKLGLEKWNELCKVSQLVKMMLSQSPPGAWGMGKISIDVPHWARSVRWKSMKFSWYYQLTFMPLTSQPLWISLEMFVFYYKWVTSSSFHYRSPKWAEPESIPSRITSEALVSCVDLHSSGYQYLGKQQSPRPYQGDRKGGNHELGVLIAICSLFLSRQVGWLICSKVFHFCHIWPWRHPSEDGHPGCFCWQCWLFWTHKRQGS